MKLEKEWLVIPAFIFLVVFSMFIIELSSTLNAPITSRAITGVVELCINHPPIIDFSNCDFKTSLNKVYTCQVDVIDTDTNIKFYDDSDLFEINYTTGLISFIPLKSGHYSFNITADDGSPCPNNKYSKVLNLEVTQTYEPVIIEDSKKSIRSDTYTGPRHVPKYDVDLVSEFSVIVRGDDTTHIYLRLKNTGNQILNNLVFKTYTPHDFNVIVVPNKISMLSLGEEFEIILEFDRVFEGGNYDVFLFIDADDELYKQFRINVDLELGVSVFRDFGNYFDREMMSGLQFNYTLTDWLIVLIMATLLFFVITKIVFI